MHFEKYFSFCSPQKIFLHKITFFGNITEKIFLKRTQKFLPAGEFMDKKISYPIDETLSDVVNKKMSDTAFYQNN